MRVRTAILMNGSSATACQFVKPAMAAPINVALSTLMMS